MPARFCKGWIPYTKSCTANWVSKCYGVNPCPSLLPDEQEIPIAWYGTSHIGMIKHVYRRGLALRYGKSMQCRIAGIHYNFSPSENLWPAIASS